MKVRVVLEIELNDPEVPYPDTWAWEDLGLWGEGERAYETKLISVENIR